MTNILWSLKSHISGFSNRVGKLGFRLSNVYSLIKKYEVLSGKEWGRYEMCKTFLGIKKIRKNFNFCLNDLSKQTFVMVFSK